MKHIVLMKTQSGNTMCLTKRGMWCFFYVGVNDGLFQVFDRKVDAEQAAESKKHWNAYVADYVQ